MSRTLHAWLLPRALALLSALALPVARAQAPEPAEAASAPAAASPAASAVADVRLDTTLAPASGSEGLEAVDRVRVADPYLEFHTGPGRGYPVHFVAERGAWVGIELRHTDWYKLRAEGGQVGWVHREQLATTLTGRGERTRLREMLFDDYLHRRVEAGAALGRFQSEPLVRLWLGARTSDTLRVEASLSQVQGVYSGTSLLQFGVLSEPWSDRRWSPFLGIGVGRFHNLPSAALVDARRTDVNLADVTLGLRYHLAERFVARLDWTLYTALLGDSGYGEYRAVSAGLSFFF